MASRAWPIVLIVAGSVVLGCSGLCVFGMGLRWLAAVRGKAAEVPATIIYEQEIQYGTGGGVPLVLDMARPRQGAGLFPAVVCIHGGGWRGGDKSSFTGLIQALAQQGYVAVTIRYRFAPAHPFPAQIEDAKCAVRYLRAHAQELNVDPDHIGAMGGSAGGHLALMLGATEGTDDLEGEGGYGEFSSEVHVVGSIAGPVDLSPTFPDAVEPMLKDLLGGTREQVSEEYQRASPLTYLSPDDPPILAIHGTLDELVPYAQATSLITACQETGIEARLITIQNGAHGYGGNAQDWLDANTQLIEFFDEHLKPGPVTSSAMPREE